MIKITDIQFIGSEVALKWEDGKEGFITMEHLRGMSPSAETKGERDLMGRQFTGDEQGKDFSGVTVTRWTPVGGYAIQFHFSDGHNTGIYAFDYLREIVD